MHLGVILTDQDIDDGVFDVVVIGAGPNGLYAAYKISQELPWASLIVVEQSEICGSISQYPDVRWHSKMKELKLPSLLNSVIPDEYEPTSSELVSYYKNFAKEHSISIRTKSRVANLVENLGEDGHRLLKLELEEGTSKNSEILSRNVILATGIFGNSRSLAISGNHELCPNYDLELRDLNLLLVGAGNSAADFIMYLLPRNRITWVIRSETWKSVFANLSARFEEILKEFRPNLTLITNTEVVSVEKSGHVKLSDGEVVGPFDKSFSLIGFSSLSPLIHSIGLETEFECLALSSCFETSLKSVFALGSVSATWDPTTNRPNPTFIHNGNDGQLGIILRELKERRAKEVFAMNQAFAVVSGSENRFGLKSVFWRKPRLR